MSATDGVLIVDKPRGPTSHDVVAQARRHFKTRAVGHAGTLDPMATGVLVLVLGEATKLVPFLTDENKRYRAVVRFGIETDTGDAEGVTVRQLECRLGELERQQLLPALEQERQRTTQVPPVISAIKVGGKPAHRLTRRGEAPELAERPVAVRELQLLEVGEQSVAVELCVTKGYYVRSFARDLGRALGLPACLTELRRLASGSFALEEAVAWPPNAPPQVLSLAAAARRVLPAIELTANGERRARLGQRLAASDFHTPPDAGVGKAAWFGESGELVAIGEQRASDFAVVRGFRAQAD